MNSLVKNSEFIPWVETCIGLGVVLVVLGHSIADIMPEHSSVFSFIYSFHMPLFFFISGYVGSKALDQYTLNEKYQYWKKKLKD